MNYETDRKSMMFSICHYWSKTLKKKWVKKKSKFKADLKAENNIGYIIKVILDSIIYAQKLEASQQIKFYYLVS